MSQELPDGVELPSYTAMKTAAMILSDCGHSTNNTQLHERVARRVDAHSDAHAAAILADREKQAARVPEEGWKLVPVDVLKAASQSLGNFVMDHGWGDADMQAMDNLDAFIDAPTTEPSKAERTLLEQYDLDQSPEYRKGYEDGRLKGFEVGQRYAKEASKAEQADAPSGMAMMPIEPTAHLLSMIPAMTDDDAHHLYQRLIGVAQLEGVRLKVKAFGCSNETRGKSRCDSWCRADNICPASYERLDSPTQPPASNAAQDNYKVWYEEAMGASNEAGFVGASAADTIRALTRLLAAAERAALATKPQAGDVAQDKEHAENYRLIRRGQHWSVVDGIGNTLRGDDLDAAVDAIRAARAARTRGEGGGT